MLEATMAVGKGARLLLLLRICCIVQRLAMTTASPVPVIVLKNPRSGSSWFVQLLNSASGVFVTEEILTSKSGKHGDIALHGEAYLERALREPMNRFAAGPAFGSSGPQRSLKHKTVPIDGWTVVGFTVSPKRLLAGDINITALAMRTAAKMIIYERTNKVKQAIAYYRGRLLRDKCGFNNVRTTESACTLSTVHFKLDINTFERNLLESMAKDYALAEANIPHSAHRVTYEGLLSDTNSTLQAVFAYLGAPAPTQGLRNAYAKSTSDDLRAIITNFDQVEHWLALNAPCLLPHLRETNPGALQTQTCNDTLHQRVRAYMRHSRSWRPDHDIAKRSHSRKQEGSHHHRRRSSLHASKPHVKQRGASV